MRDPQPRSFSDQVHQVVDLDTRRAASPTTDADLMSSAVDPEVEFALRVLATSLRETHRGDRVIAVR